MTAKALPFAITHEMTGEQAQAIDRALKGHNIIVPDGSECGCFDWLCERIEVALNAYAFTKTWKPPQSRAEVLKDINKLQSALELMGSEAKGVVMEAAIHTEAYELFHHTGLDKELQPMLDRIMETGIGAHGNLSDSRTSSFEWLFDYGQIGLREIAWNMIEEACRLALSDDPPKSWQAGIDVFGTPDRSIIESHTPSVKGGRPRDDAKHELVRELAREFEAVAHRPATETEDGPFDEFLSACLSIVEPTSADRTTNRKLIRKALEHVPKPRKRN